MVSIFGYVHMGVPVSKAAKKWVPDAFELVRDDKWSLGMGAKIKTLVLMKKQ